MDCHATAGDIILDRIVAEVVNPSFGFGTKPIQKADKIKKLYFGDKADEGFDLFNVLPPSSWRQATVHRTVAFWIGSNPYPQQNKNPKT